MASKLSSPNGGRKVSVQPALVGVGVAATLAERGARYGDFTDHARVCQDIKRAYNAAPNAHAMNDVQRQALEVIADKMARIVCGDPNYADNWHDIQGYAKLAEERLDAE